MQRITLKTLFITILLALSFVCRGQYDITMTAATTTIDLCRHPSGTIYDDGGPASQYSNNFTGTVVLTTAPGFTIWLQGSYNTENGFDKIWVYDGVGTAGTILANGVSGIDSLSVTTTSGALTLRFVSDREESRPGFAFHFHRSDADDVCTNLPNDLHFSNIGRHSARIGWSATSAGGPFLLGINGTQTVAYDTFYVATGLPQLSNIVVAVSSRADSMSSCCTIADSFFTVCSTITDSTLPYSNHFDTDTVRPPAPQDSCWHFLSGTPGTPALSTAHPHTGNRSLILRGTPAGDFNIVSLPEYDGSAGRLMLDFWARNADPGTTETIDVGLIDNPGSDSTFEMLAVLQIEGNEYSHHVALLPPIDISGRYIALRKQSEHAVYLDDIRLSKVPECPTATNFRIAGRSSNAIAVAWDAISTTAQDTTTFEIRAIPLGGGTTASTTANHCPAIISGLAPSTRYVLKIKALCDTAAWNEADSIICTTGCMGEATSAPSGFMGTVSWGVPIFENAGNSFCQSIYTASELRAMGMRSGYINSLSLGWTENTTAPKHLSIYLALTARYDFSTNTTPFSTTLTCVHSAPHGLHVQGEVTYPFNEPFFWDGVSNLVVTITMNQPDRVPQNSTGFFGTSSISPATSSLHTHRDNTAYHSSEFATLACATSQLRPDIAFTMCDTTPSCPAPLVIIDSVSNHQIGISWCRGGTETSWQIAYKESFSDTWNTVAYRYADTSYVFTELASGVAYDIRVTANCLGINGHTTLSCHTQCDPRDFVYDDLHAANVTCRYGTVANPNRRTGVVDYGPAIPASRHTIHTDKMETDPRTGYRLNTIPAGHCSSVRLGNWLSSAEAESITYTYTVDTNNYDLLLLKYSAVMQNPNHTDAEQPKFKFRITDLDDNEINVCYEATFAANSRLNWNTYGDVVWKDWTTMGVDLTTLHGMTIKIHLETHDCSQGSHYGYAYFVIDQDHLRIRTVGCSQDDKTFYAPEGFAYTWFSADDPMLILSTDDSLHVSHGGTYYCDLQFIGAPNDAQHASCHITLRAEAGDRFPVANFEAVQTDTTGCELATFAFRNKSIVAGDYAHLDTVATHCEDYLWVFDDGTTSTQANPTHDFTPGLHTVTLYSMISEGHCADTITDTILAVVPCMIIDTIDHTMCLGDTLIVFDTALTEDGTYLLDSAFTADSVWVKVIHLSTHGTLTDTVAYNVCGEYFWSQNQQRYTATGIYHDTTWHSAHCDSITVLDLTVQPTYNISIYDTICQGKTYLFHHTVLRLPGTYCDTLPTSTTPQCDSIITLHLHTNPTYHIEFYDTMYYGDTIVIAGTRYTQPGDYTMNLTSTQGCDSTVIRHIFGRRLVRVNLTDTICLGDTLRHLGHIITHSGTFIDTLRTAPPIYSDTCITLNVVAVPHIPSIVEVSRICGTEAHYHLHSTNEAPYYLWTAEPPDPSLRGQEHRNSIDVHPDTITTYTLYCDYRSEPQCRTHQRQSLEPIKNVRAIIHAHPSAITYGSRQLKAIDNSQGDILSRRWQVWYNDYVAWSSSDEELDFVVPTHVHSLVLELGVNSEHCADTDVVEIDILGSNLSFPNTFTPTQFTNNVFKGVGIGITQYELWIYNRQGHLVFHSVDINEGWDGTSHGAPCHQGAYVYRCRYQCQETPGGSQTVTGTVTLLR